VSPREVKRIRQLLGLTQRQFADTLHVARESVARWEVGMSKPTGLYLEALKALAAKAKRKTKR
jgi:DNA-binding transcriptional regulator YiaG